MNELHKDPVSGDWVIMSPGRAKRPEQLIRKRVPRRPTPRNECPFEDLSRSGNEPIMLVPQGAKWRIAVIPNKYPALSHDAGRSKNLRAGIYEAKTGTGDHEVVITRDHMKNFAALSSKEAAALFVVLQARMRALARHHGNAYTATFCNWGREAGASLWHPHYQILSLPIIPPHALQSIHGAEAYYKKSHACARCEIIAAERRARVRVIAENAHAIAIAPFASKHAFEVHILPRKHSSSFRTASRIVLASTAALLQDVMRRMEKNLHDPDLNFYIHDAPSDKREYSFHHWHIGVVPTNVISPPGGFEISTVVNINVIDPATAAAVLRGKEKSKK